MEQEFNKLAMIFNKGARIKYKKNKKNHPKTICLNGIRYQKNTKIHNIKTTRGYVAFYYNKEKEIVLKCVDCDYFIYSGLAELKATTLLENYPQQYIQPIQYAFLYSNCIYFITRAHFNDLRNIQQWEDKNQIKPSFEKVILILDNVTNALLYLHSLDIVYNDLKSENIVLNAKTNTFLLIDFEFIEKTSPNQKGYSRNGTPTMMSFNRLSFYRTSILDDIWSLSMVLYEYVTKKDSPFKSLLDFTESNQKNLMLDMQIATQHWEKNQSQFLLDLFTKMNIYNTDDVIPIFDLRKQIDVGLSFC